MNRPTLVATLAVLALSGASAPAAYAQWAPPIGIPAPSFGIVETARPAPNPWTAQTPGYYYVDATEPTATDTSNSYGTPGRPRQTIPTALPAGAVVELHGVYDASHSSPRTIVASGTSGSPVFIRGASASARPLIRNAWELKGTYVILENLEFGALDANQTGELAILAPINYAALRHSDLHGNLNGGGMGVASWNGSLAQNVVVYDVSIHDNGDINATFDQDVHGIAVSYRANRAGATRGADGARQTAEVLDRRAEACRSRGSGPGSRLAGADGFRCRRCCTGSD